MNQVYLSDGEITESLFPLTLTRSAADIRIGILTIREKWNHYLGQPVMLVDEELSVPDNATIFSSAVIPSAAFIQSLFNNNAVSENPAWNQVKIMHFPWHVFEWNDWALREDFKLITANRQSLKVPGHVFATNVQNIFIEEGAKLSHCFINAEEGPVYIGKNAIIMEGAMIRGPFALCENATVKMGAKIYGATTVGPHSIVGGEIKNSVIFGYSNKSHDGYLGDSVIGEWCNLGAGTTNSNLKNNASKIRMYSRSEKAMINSELIKCGVIMGDYSRSSINTSFNTGTVVGVCANVFGSGLSPKYIPSFSWGADGAGEYAFDKAIDDIDKWKKLKGRFLTEQEKNRLRLIFEQN